MYKSIKPTDFVDFHTHTTSSDGMLTPDVLVQKARAAHICVLAITDHNQITDIPDATPPDMLLLPGVEVSCTFEQTEIHVIGLGVRNDCAPLNALLNYNREGRRNYITAILDNLRKCGIDLGSFDDLFAKHPDTHQLGRMHIASDLVDLGYVPDSNDAFRLYLGAGGSAYVKNQHDFCSLSAAVKAIHQAGGIPILAHPYYYHLDAEHFQQLLLKWKDLASLLQTPLGIEVFYPMHNTEETATLKDIARELGFMPSTASDYHANGSDSLMEYNAEMCTDLLNALGIEIE
ncbi:MAG: PHP domain-containing protein [Eggerthellaceae bacterium]|nr:PHP domain-containing protein [Eggerthellaceae bacterium]